MLETTPSGHEDYPNIKNALREMESLGDYINENKRHHEQINQILDIQAKLQKFPEETLVKPGRVFIRDGVLLRGKERYNVFLFTDALIYSKPKVRRIEAEMLTPVRASASRSKE